MNKKYILIALLSVFNLGLANNSENTKDSALTKESIQKLSDTELQQEFKKASEAVIAEEYRCAKLEFEFCECKLKNADDKTACDELKKQYDAVWNNDLSKEFHGIVHEKHWRGLREGLVGRGSMHSIIGRTNFENGQADLYRSEKQLHTKSNGELHARQNKIEEELKNNSAYRESAAGSDEFDYYYAHRVFAQIEKLAIERELKEPHRAEKN